jgi:hypothetical protein
MKTTIEHVTQRFMLATCPQKPRYTSDPGASISTLNIRKGWKDDT